MLEGCARTTPSEPWLPTAKVVHFLLPQLSALSSASTHTLGHQDLAMHAYCFTWPHSGHTRPPM